MTTKTYNVTLFVRNILRFLIVCTCIYVIVLEFSLYKLGESGKYEKIINKQIKYNVLFGRKLTNETLEYKIMGAQIIKPKILTLGTSRIMQVRQQFFKSHIIYNAAISASISQGIGEMKHFLDMVKDSTNIKHVIIGLDPWLFNPNYPDNQRANKTESLKSKLKKRLSNFPLLYNGLKQLKSYLSDISARPIIYRKLIPEYQSSLRYLFKDRQFKGYGLNSKIHNSGFRFDGSYQYPGDYQEGWLDASIISYKNSLKNDNYRFSPAQNIYYDSLYELQQLLDFAKSEQINVIGLMPPFSPNFYSALTSMENRKSFIKDYEIKVCSTLVKNGFKCYNYSDIRKYPQLNIHSGDFYDNTHAKPILINKIISNILNDMNN